MKAYASFTLIEFIMWLLVVAILGVITGMGITSISKTKEQTTQDQITINTDSIKKINTRIDFIVEKNGLTIAREEKSGKTTP